MKKWWNLGVVVSAAIIGVSIVALVQQPAPATLQLGEGKFSLRVARTDSERERGLSGTAELPSTEALAFVFPTSDRWGIWMKDMRYPIDIIWLDDSKVVRHIEQRVQPNTYPAKTFQPNDPAKYVIELKAGVVSSQRITIGSQAVFDSTKGSFE